MLRHPRNINSGALLPSSPERGRGRGWYYWGPVEMSWGVEAATITEECSTTRTQAANQKGTGKKHWADLSLLSSSSLLWLPLANADWKLAIGGHGMEYVRVGLVAQSKADIDQVCGFKGNHTLKHSLCEAVTWM